MTELKIATISLDITWADVEENLYAVEASIRRLDKNTDLVVLPELFTTGYLSSPELLYKFAEEEKYSKTLDSLHEWSKKYNVAITGSFLVRVDDKFYNRGFFIEPSGDETFYDKTHLFSLSNESKTLTPGVAPIPVVRFRGWNIALAVCYELRFPVWLRNTDNRYDVLVIPANWPSKRAYAWKHLLIARAIENQAYVIGVNRSGKDDSGSYDDMTYVFNYIGKPVETKEIANTGISTALLDRDRLLSYREAYPFWEDADRFILK